MKIDFNDLLGAFSDALDCVERDTLGATSNHSKRVAYISILIGKQMNFCKRQLIDLAACALLHDNALTQYLHTEFQAGRDILADKTLFDPKPHCIMGEDNLKNIPISNFEEGILKYHHENADGSGPFGRKSDETPLFAQIVHLADSIDVAWPFSEMNNERLGTLRSFVKNNVGILYSNECAEAFLSAYSSEEHQAVREKNIDDLLDSNLPRAVREYSAEEIKKFATLFAKIIDYKSNFTMHHSVGIAEKAEKMAKFYGYSDEMTAEMYFTGAVHDLGKLVISTDILEKPSQLTSAEYKNIQNHAYASYQILSKVDGLETITHWAALHHEKLNGKGYPFGKTAEQLDFNDRLMACLDIYQALRERRPYKEPMSHEKTLEILRDMSANGFIDGKIVEDIDKVLKDAA